MPGDSNQVGQVVDGGIGAAVGGRFRATQGEQQTERSFPTRTTRALSKGEACKASGAYSEGEMPDVDRGVAR